MDARLPPMLKDAALTALIAAALGIFIAGFRTYDVGKGLTFDFQLVDLAIAVVTIFFGRLGLQLASIGLKWPAFVLGTILGAIGAAPVRLPSTFLHWFIVLAGILIILRTIWPWANAAMAHARHSPRGVIYSQHFAKWFGAALLVAAVLMPFAPFAAPGRIPLLSFLSRWRTESAHVRTR